MRIIRIIRRVAKVPKVWRNLQKCDRLLRENGFKHVYQLQWENDLQDFTRSEIIQIHRWAGTPFKSLRNIPIVNATTAENAQNQLAWFTQRLYMPTQIHSPRGRFTFHRLPSKTGTRSQSRQSKFRAGSEQDDNARLG